MTESFPEQVYNTLNGFYIPSFNVPGVENAFADGEQCMLLYLNARDAYTHICERLGLADDEDDDVEIIYSSFSDITKILCLKMYHYGALFGEDPETV